MYRDVTGSVFTGNPSRFTSKNINYVITKVIDPVDVTENNHPLSTLRDEFKY